VPEVVRRLTAQCIEHLRQLGQLPARAQYRFDGPQEGCTVQKTRTRVVRSLRYSEFEAKEVIRQQKFQGQSRVRRSEELAETVPNGSGHAYDLICHVGINTILNGFTLRDIQTDLQSLTPPMDVAISTLYEQQYRFYFHLGHFHEASTDRMRKYLEERGDVVWLVDGTLEPGSPVFFRPTGCQGGLYAC
jgi:hypothetical protein